LRRMIALSIAGTGYALAVRSQKKKIVGKI
jgi:hypothetical protein